jgi:hypothetical protein
VPTRPGAAADRARISLSALTPGLGTGLPQRRGQPGRSLQQPGDILLALILGACPLCRQPVTPGRLAAALTPT